MQILMQKIALCLVLLFFCNISTGEEQEYRYVLYDEDKAEYTDYQEYNQTSGVQGGYGDYYDYDYEKRDMEQVDNLGLDEQDGATEPYSGSGFEQESEPQETISSVPDKPPGVYSQPGEEGEEGIEGENKEEGRRDNEDQEIKENENENVEPEIDNFETSEIQEEEITEEEMRTEEMDYTENQEGEKEEDRRRKEEEDDYTENQNKENEDERRRNEDERKNEKNEEKEYDYDYSEKNQNNEETRDSESDYNEDEDMDTLYRNYEILSEFYQKYFVDLRILDLTCDPVSVPAPTVNNGRVAKYTEVDNILLPKKKYRQAVYECNRGYIISSRTSNSLFCQDYTWTGLEPECEKSELEDEYSVPQGEINPSECDPDSGCEQECKLEDGEPVCYCSPGYRMENNECLDVDECEIENGDCDEECHNKPGSYICSCPSGFELGEDGHRCLDVNECLANNGHGPCQDICVNVEGFYYCECGGIPGTRLSADQHTCEVVNLCLENNGGCSHSCLSVNGQAFCSCPSGFELGDDWKTCRDINECRTTENTCPGECFNTVGSFSCSYSCPDTHIYIDGECKPGCKPGSVLVDGDCKPTCKDGYIRVENKCVKFCSPGYKLDGSQCVEDCADGEVLKKGECVSVCQPDVCGMGVCEEDGEGYKCICDHGYIFLQGTCEDLDECTGADSLCPEGDCVNTEGSFYCHCKDGYRNDNGVCVDINECEEGVICSQECVNTPGSYECRCWEGFTLNPGSGSCSDIDECSLRPSICEQGCENLAGGFQCICGSGFQPDSADNTKCLRAGCQPLDPPDGGKLKCTAGPLKVGSTCTLYCKKGFLRKGRASRKCLENGEWEEGAGWCDERKCPPITPMENMIVSPTDCMKDRHDFRKRCSARCEPGFVLQGTQNLICGKRGRWIQREGSPFCSPGPTSVPDTPDQISPPPPPPPSRTPTPSPHPSPYIICPPDILVNLTDKVPLRITIPAPKTNMNWEHEVRSEPVWAKHLSFPVGPGVLNIKFSAFHPGSNHIASCRMSIKAIDTKPPSVENCPNSFTVFLEPGEDERKVNWDEPEFQDNVGVTSVLASQLPGQNLGLGRHVVIYQALDSAGNRERCVFSIRVANLSPEISAPNPTSRIWVLCRVGNTGRHIRLLVSRVPPGCRRINIRP